MDNRIIFLGGSPRSGTTLLQNMLDCHPEILGGPEFLHLPDIVRLRNQLQGSVEKNWISLICSSDEVDDQIRSMILNLLLPFADKHDAKYLSEKTPENVLVFSRLIELFPDAKFIHVVRDPRATIASLLSVGKKAREKGEAPAPFARNLSSAIAYVRKCLKAGFDAHAAAPEHVFNVVYEDLTREPERVSRELCDFLGVEWSESLLKPGEKSHLGEAAITVNSKEIWYDAKTYNSNPNTSSLEKWRSSLNAVQQIAIVRSFSGFDQLKQLGYQLSVNDLDTRDKITGNLIYSVGRVFTALKKRLRALVG
ncbi:MAG: sulfotransferase [Gammaproteobacteria bacterium]